MDYLCADLRDSIWKKCPLITAVCLESAASNSKYRQLAHLAFLHWHICMKMYSPKHDQFALKFKFILLPSKYQAIVNSSVPSMQFKVRHYFIIRLRRHVQSQTLSRYSFSNFCHFVPMHTKSRLCLLCRLDDTGFLCFNSFSSDNFLETESTRLGNNFMCKNVIILYLQSTLIIIIIPFCLAFAVCSEIHCGKITFPWQYASSHSPSKKFLITPTKSGTMKK